MDAQNYMKLCKNSPSLRRYKPPTRPLSLLNAVPPTPGQQLANPSQTFWKFIGTEHSTSTHTE